VERGVLGGSGYGGGFASGMECRRGPVGRNGTGGWATVQSAADGSGSGSSGESEAEDFVDLADDGAGFAIGELAVGV